MCKTRLTTANRSRVSVRGQPCKIFLTCTSVTRQKFVAVSDTVYAHVGGPEMLGYAGTSPVLGTGRGWVLETHPCPARVTVTDFVALGQTVLAYVGASKHLGTLEPCPLGWGRGWPPRNTEWHVTRLSSRSRRSLSGRLDSATGGRLGEVGSEGCVSVNRSSCRIIAFTLHVTRTWLWIQWRRSVVKYGVSVGVSLVIAQRPFKRTL